MKVQRWVLSLQTLCSVTVLYGDEAKTKSPTYMRNIRRYPRLIAAGSAILALPGELFSGPDPAICASEPCGLQPHAASIMMAGLGPSAGLLVAETAQAGAVTPGAPQHRQQASAGQPTSGKPRFSCPAHAPSSLDPGAGANTNGGESGPTSARLSVFHSIKSQPLWAPVATRRYNNYYQFLLFRPASTLSAFLQFFQGPVWGLHPSTPPCQGATAALASCPASREEFYPSVNEQPPRQSAPASAPAPAFRRSPGPEAETRQVNRSQWHGSKCSSPYQALVEIPAFRVRTTQDRTTAPKCDSGQTGTYIIPIRPHSTSRATSRFCR
jgi:hypothetical protein